MYTNKQIWNVSFPIVLSLLAQNIINVTDTAFLGRVSEVALGGSAMGGLFYICIFTVAFGFSTGSQIMIARRNGEQRYSEVGPVMIQGVIFLLAAALFMFLFTRVFGEDIMHLLCHRIQSLMRQWIICIGVYRFLLFIYQCDVPCILYRSNQNEGAYYQCYCYGSYECGFRLCIDIRKLRIPRNGHSGCSYCIGHSRGLIYSILPDLHLCDC